MEKLQETANWEAQIKARSRRGSTACWNIIRLHSCCSTVCHVVVVYLSLAAASSSLWCTSSNGQASPVGAPASSTPITNVPASAPAPSPASTSNPTDPGQMATLYSLYSWPDVWRQKGTVPNITDMTITNRDPCTSKWVGIYCDGGSPYQFILNVTVVDVSGKYPSNFLTVMSNLTTLMFLRIYQKGDAAVSSLSGTIPASLGQLQSLQELNLRGNQLTGGFPVEIARLPLLNYVNVADNQLSGPYDQFCESQSLQTILLFNNLFNQSIPSCLGNMNLTNLNLGANMVSGSIPDSFANLTNMLTLNLDNTTLTGGLNNSMVATWRYLTSISCRRSNLSGPIPEALGSLPYLTSIQLGQNQFSGSIPTSLGKLQSLMYLALYDNRLTGEVPVELGGMQNLTHLLLANNSLSGLVPSSLSGLSKLQHLHLQGNNFSGPFDAGIITNMTGLLGLFLQENNFSGSFPSGQIFNSCLSLVNVSLSYNEFTGPVLDEGASLPVNLTFLLMSYNNFSGSIPSAIGETTKLKYLDLAKNNLSGNVPPEVMSKLTIAPSAQINLSFNKLNVSKQSTQSGFGLFTCSSQDANCTEYHVGNGEGVAINVGGPQYLDYEADVVTPDFPIGMFTVSTSSMWSMSTAGVDGAWMINRTQTLTNADSIDHWTLYNTARTGADSFTYYIHSLQLGKYKVGLGFVELIADMREGERIFDIWIQNQLVLQGMDVVVRAPGHFRAFVEEFDVELTSESLGLLTIELRGHGSWPLVFNKRFKQGYYYGPILSALHVYRIHGLSKLARTAAEASAAVVGFILVVLAFLLGTFCERRKRRLQKLEEEHAKLGLKFFRLGELEAATEKWSNENLLGEGAFGKVYKGLLPDGTTVAIKKLTTKANGPYCSKEAFINEARIISSTRHRTLIALLGCCFEASQPLFVCEYMPNGNLHDALFVRRICLDWTQRWAIAKDVASGLLYLHEETSNRIIHRDVKPANILLDDKFNARVADFGLARLVADQEIDVVTDVMGTRGYLAPEYALNGQLSDKVDVFSYGVVLLELVSGRHGLQPSRDLPSPVPISIVQWAWDMVTDGKVLAVVDPALDFKFYNEDLIRIVEIALWCTQSHPHMRPSMSQVVRMLHKQARIPPLSEERTNYETRDISKLPYTPFDNVEWESYISMASEASMAQFKDLQGFSPIISPSEASEASEASKSSVNLGNFDNSTICPVSGSLAR